MNPSAAPAASVVAGRASPGASRVAPAASHRGWRHGFACFQVLCTWVLIVAGASVTSHDAGLAVPDWPTSYGWLNPFAVPMVGNVFYEHGHREVAELVGLVTVIEAIWLWRTAERPLLKKLAAWLVGLVLLQGTLGGITVHLYLPPLVSIAHGMLAQSFFCLSIVTAYLLSREWSATVARATAGAAALKRVALCAAGAVYVQLLLGAVVRHCWKKEMPPEAFPPRFGDLLPPFADPPVSHGLSAAILVHGCFALVVATTLLFAAGFVVKKRRGERRLTRIAVALAALVVVQVGLGLLTFATRTNPNVTTTHVVVGATILGGAVLLVLRSFRAPAPSASPEPAP